MALFKKNTEDEYGEQTKRTINVPSILTLVVIVALIVVFIIKFWNMDEDVTSVDVPGTIEATPEPVSEDESEGQFARNIESDIKYVLSSKDYKRENVHESHAFQTLDSIRKVYGKQGDVQISVAYVDGELSSESRNAIVFIFGCRNDEGTHQIELRVEYSAQNSSNGFLDYYATSATFVEK